MTTREASVRAELTAEVLLRIAVDESGGWRSKLLHKDALCVGSLHAIHRIVAEGEVLACEELLDGAKIEDLLQQPQMVLDAVEHLHAERATKLVRALLGEVHIRDVGAQLVLRDLRGVCVYEIRHLKGCQAGASS
eukprot:scaffold1296_cov129-Isochrysis_galbana.AAC.4